MEVDKESSSREAEKSGPATQEMQSEFSRVLSSLVHEAETLQSRILQKKVQFQVNADSNDLPPPVNRPLPNLKHMKNKRQALFFHNLSAPNTKDELQKLVQNYLNTKFSYLWHTKAKNVSLRSKILSQALKDDEGINLELSSDLRKYLKDLLAEHLELSSQCVQTEVQKAQLTMEHNQVWRRKAELNEEMAKMHLEIRELTKKLEDANTTENDERQELKDIQTKREALLREEERVIRFKCLLSRLFFAFPEGYLDDDTQDTIDNAIIVFSQNIENIKKEYLTTQTQKRTSI